MAFPLKGKYFFSSKIWRVIDLAVAKVDPWKFLFDKLQIFNITLTISSLCGLYSKSFEIVIYDHNDSTIMEPLL
jgi:hypothetical protein